MTITPSDTTVVVLLAILASAILWVALDLIILLASLFALGIVFTAPLDFENGPSSSAVDKENDDESEVQRDKPTCRRKSPTDSVKDDPGYEADCDSDGNCSRGTDRNSFESDNLDNDDSEKVKSRDSNDNNENSNGGGGATESLLAFLITSALLALTLCPGWYSPWTTIATPLFSSLVIFIDWDEDWAHAAMFRASIGRAFETVVVNRTVRRVVGVVLKVVDAVVSSVRRESKTENEVEGEWRGRTRVRILYDDMRKPSLMTVLPGQSWRGGIQDSPEKNTEIPGLLQLD